MTSPSARDRFAASWGEVGFAAPCPSCRHKTLGKATCAAFPGGIPDDILDGKVQHRTPFPGDHGIQYEPAE